MCLPCAPTQGQVWRPRTHRLTGTLFLFTRLGHPPAHPLQPPRVLGPCPIRPQQAQTCDWLVVDSPAYSGCRAAPGHTAKPQPVPKVQAVVPRQGGEDRRCQDGEVHAAAGTAHGILGSAGVGASVLALWAKGGVSLRTAPTPTWARMPPGTCSLAGSHGPSSPERQSDLPKVTQLANSSASPLHLPAAFIWLCALMKYNLYFKAGQEKLNIKFSVFWGLLLPSLMCSVYLHYTLTRAPQGWVCLLSCKDLFFFPFL